uniref:hypothetical protein n=1 Tax=Gemmiger formicilis TaxID=745368 RepID=UPI00402A2BD9
MREPIVINAETREITVPETERAFGVAGERKVEVKHIRIEGRTVDGTDLTQGFTWKVSCENAGKELCADLIDGIVADAGNIEFDWIVGAAPMAYKGTMHFAVCAVRVDAAGNILQEWHSMLGAGDVANGIEATVQNIGGQDLLAHIQSITAAAQQNAAATQRDAAAAAKSAKDAATSEGNAAASAKKAQDVSDSLPADYTAMSSDVGTLKNQMQRAYPDNSTIGENPWSSKNIVDMLCPPIEESGNPVVCYPVAGYQLGVKAKWEPMQEGGGTPSPENIRPIKGRDSLKVERCGENLFDIAKVTETNILTKTDRQITLKTGRVHNYDLFVSTVGLTTAVPIDRLDRLPFFLKGTYKISYNTTLPGASLAIVAVAKDGSITVISTNSQAYFTLSYGTLISIRCGPVEEVTFSNIQITIGSTAPTTYTPYIGQTNTLTLPETVYGGEVDAVTGEGRKMWKTVTLDGDSNFTILDGNVWLWFNFSQDWNKTDRNVLSSHYDSYIGAWVDMPNQSVQLIDNALGIRDDRFSSVADLKAYLAAQHAAGTPVQVCYNLAEPVPFTATGAQPIPALAGVNTVLTDADSATVTGRADPIKRITDLEDAVASQT